MLCSRKTDDPLLKLLLDWSINPFRTARRQSPVGALYIFSKSGLGKSSTQQVWEDPSQAFVPALPRVESTVIDTPKGQTLTNVGSSNLDLSTTVNVVARMLPGLDDKGKVALRTALAAANAATCSVRLVEPRIERIKLDKLQLEMGARDFSEGFSKVILGAQVYFCTGGWSAKALEISATDKDRRSVKLGVELEAVLKANGDAGIKLVEGAKARMAFKSDEQLFFGAELMRVERHSGGGLVLTGYRPRAALAGEGEKEGRAHDAPTPIEEIWLEDEDCVLV